MGVGIATGRSPSHGIVQLTEQFDASWRLRHSPIRTSNCFDGWTCARGSSVFAEWHAGCLNYSAGGLKAAFSSLMRQMPAAVRTSSEA